MNKQSKKIVSFGPWRITFHSNWSEFRAMKRLPCVRLSRRCLRFELRESCVAIRQRVTATRQIHCSAMNIEGK